MRVNKGRAKCRQGRSSICSHDLSQERAHARARAIVRKMSVGPPPRRGLRFDLLPAPTSQIETVNVEARTDTTLLGVRIGSTLFVFDKAPHTKGSLFSTVASLLQTVRDRIYSGTYSMRIVANQLFKGENGSMIFSFVAERKTTNDLWISSMTAVALVSDPWQACPAPVSVVPVGDLSWGGVDWKLNNE